MLEDTGYGVSEKASIERCKPDYEDQIKREKQYLDKVEKFLTATMEYLDGMNARRKMAELVGELYSRKVKHKRNIQSLIKQQEKEGGE